MRTGTIFQWQTKQLSNQVDATEGIVYHKIFSEKTEFQVNFKERQIRDDFNEGLKHIREKGIYQQIFDK